MKRSTKGALVAAAVAGMFATRIAVAAEEGGTGEAKKAEVRCQGVNACKGQGACGGAGHDCAGKNECKGKGWIETSAADCKAKDGTVVNKAGVPAQ